jgi:hypothetical protein
MSETEPNNQSPRPIEVAVYYFPNYHRDARNDVWHGNGWTEWELVKAAKPRYPGHQQPKVPQWGYFDESDPAWASREIDLAADHGITTFVYDWYWYDDAPYLQGGLEEGFLRAENTERLKFALMWANHDWMNIHPATFTNRPEKLTTGAISPGSFERLSDYVLERYFTRANYLTIDGCPYFSIYEIGRFILGMGGVEEAKASLDRFRDKARKAGFDDLHLNAVVWGFDTLPGECAMRDAAEIVRYLGFDSVTSYAWIHHHRSETFPRGSYAAAAADNVKAWDKYRTMFPGVPYHPNVSMGWDSSPRTVQTSPFEYRGYPWMSILEGNTPDAFAAALTRAKEFADDEPTGSARMVMINAWNEWTEGSYLLPDEINGEAYLQSVRSVFGVE